MKPLHQPFPWQPIVNQMIPEFHLTKPSTFMQGIPYLVHERNAGGQREDISVVKFINYDPCPAFVIVQKADGIRLRCLRDDIYTLTNADHSAAVFQLASLFWRGMKKFALVHKAHP
jgi:hypothetical protein